MAKPDAELGATMKAVGLVVKQTGGMKLNDDLRVALLALGGTSLGIQGFPRSGQPVRPCSRADRHRPVHAGCLVRARCGGNGPARRSGTISALAASRRALSRRSARCVLHRRRPAAAHGR
jgi:hypothetical protein